MKAIAAPIRTDLEQRALDLRAQGYGYRRIGEALGVSTTTARRWTKPGYAEHLRAVSRDAKRRRLGACQDCGAETHYNGHGVSPRCIPCALAITRVERRERGREKFVAALQEYHAETGLTPTLTVWIREKRRPWFTNAYNLFGSWHDALEAAGFKSRYARPKQRERSDETRKVRNR